MRRYQNKMTAIVALLMIVTTALGAGLDPAPVKPGDRIAFVGNTFADQLRNHGYLETLLLQRSMGDPVSIRNLGWAGDMLTARDRPTGFPSEESELVSHKTDVIIACFGMGESFQGATGLTEFRLALADFIASHVGNKYNGDSNVRLVLVSPIAYEDLGALTPNWEQRNAHLNAYTRVMGDVAAGAEVPFINLNEVTSELMRDGEPEKDETAPKLTRNGINLNDYGYWCVSRALADALMSGPSPWQLSVDPRSAKGEGRGGVVGEVMRQGEGLVFQVKETTWPSLGPPVQGRAHHGLRNSRDQLKVRGLSEGQYTLMIDGKTILSASHREWAEGVVIESTPAHENLEEYRAAIHDKNLSFLHSWKALNQVHIVGERRRSPSGRALPGEVIQFKTLADEADAGLARGIELRTREWRLVPSDS